MIEPVKIVINALPYKQNSSGIGVLIREFFGAYVLTVSRHCQIILTQDAPDFDGGNRVEIIYEKFRYREGLQRIFFQSMWFGNRYCKNAVLLTTDSKLPLLLPKSCKVVTLVTDLAVYRFPQVYQFSRVLLWRMQYFWVKRRTDCFLAISEFTKQEMADLLKIPQEKIKVVPCAAPEKMVRITATEVLDRLRRRYGLQEHFVLFVGNSNPRKNLERMLTAFDRIKTRYGFSHQLIIAGEQGWKFDREKVLAGIEHRQEVRFIGFVPDEDMPALYSAAELFVFPTLYEGFGIPVIEAQCCGTPVLTSKLSALPETGGKGAYYVDPYDVEDICEGMAQVLQNSELSKRLIEQGYQNAARFSWKNSAARLHEIIEREVIQ